jgi:hypothetical protein
MLDLIIVTIEHHLIATEIDLATGRDRDGSKHLIATRRQLACEGVGDDERGSTQPQ